MKPLEGIMVVDFSQFMAGPFASMRLADLGARVIKVERLGVGDLSRKLTLSNLVMDGDSSVFHCMNRNKESYAVDLKNPYDLAKVKQLLAQADVMIENFRPGTMERLGLGWKAVKELNPRLIYASVTGFGSTGPWKDKPGQDLLIQSLSGLAWLNGNSDGSPVPFGLATVDTFTSAHLVQGILSMLIRRDNEGVGGTVEVSLIESALDIQFEVLTTFFADGGQLPKRSNVNNAHAYLAAPYGLYATEDGYVALAMGSITDLGNILNCPDLLAYSDPKTWFSERDEIKAIIAVHLKTNTTRYWLNLLDMAGYWAAEVLQMDQFVSHEGFKTIEMVQTVSRPNGSSLVTTRCPIRIDKDILFADKWAPTVGEDNEQIEQEFGVFSGGNVSDSHETHLVSDRSLLQSTHDQRESGAKSRLSASNAGPLSGIVILDFSQFLSGPSAALRLADLGARVIKVERPDGGDLCRQLYISNTEIHGDSTIFHAINRNKESLTIDLKDIDGINLVKKLIPHVDVVIQNFRPGVMERLGLDYDSLRTINPKLIYGSIMGYGSSGPWSAKPGQDLLVQALSGLPWLNGSSNDPPVPFGLSIADMSAGAHLAQGLLACLYRRNQNGQGGLVEVSLLESILDFQFEIFTTFLNDGGKLPQRSKVNSAHAYLSAPYGIYQTADGYLALAMGSVLELGNLLRCSPLSQYVEKESWFTQRDEIKEHLQKHLQTKTTREWLAVLETADYWCAEVLTWDRLVQHQGFKDLSMIQTVLLGNQTPVQTTRCPIRLNGRILRSPLGAPKIGEHTDRILRELAD